MTISDVGKQLYTYSSTLSNAVDPGETAAHTFVTTDPTIHKSIGETIADETDALEEIKDVRSCTNI